MASLGEFGAALRELDEDRERDTFTFCGDQFVVEGEIPSMLMLQLGASATGKIEESEGLAAMWGALRCSLTAPAKGDKPEDESGFKRFYKTALDRQAEIETIMQLTFKLFEAQAGRPTKVASDSSVGPRVTSQSSSRSSSHPALAHLRPVNEVLAG